MRVVAVTSKEICLDGTEIKEFLLDGTVGVALIHLLGTAGRLEYFSTFPRPFFRVTRNSHFILKGVEGNNTFQVIFLKDTVRLEQELRELIDGTRESIAQDVKGEPEVPPDIKESTRTDSVDKNRA
jgi:hypothetical protein